MAMLVPVNVPQIGDPRRRHWAKLVTAVDTTKSTGYAYVGQFVADGGIQDLPAGGILLLYGERGGQSNPRPEAQLFTIEADASLTLEASAGGRAWARTLRDRVAELLEVELPAGPDLGGVADDFLAEELRARGWKVNRPER
ncbi:MAG TPA: hypothetical protein VIA81_10825 [Acidimicrobiia bacterium]|jgi:hypothetical protein